MRERWRQVEELFDSAVSRSPEDRAAFLDQVCGEDAELRREVESLLEADSKASGFLEPDGRSSPPHQPDLLPRLQAALGGRYVLDRELGGGGMSRVFVAEETTLGRRVVVKVLAPSLAAELDTGRFQREIRIAAGLQHPHIAPVHAAGEGGGLLYYTMPFVEGESLKQRLEHAGALPLAEAVRLLGEIADALAYAHRRRIVHRDLKPGNILLGEGHAIIIDFGIAKALSAAAEGPHAGAGLTSTGLVVGTPTYMAPEQAAGDPVDHRADLYALGCVAYELLAGEPPFRGGSAREVIAAHLADDPAPVTDHRAGVPTALAELVMRLLAKRPDDRPQSADEVRQVLQTVEAPSFEQPLPARRARAPRRLPYARLLAGLGVIALVVGAIGALVARGIRPGADPSGDGRLMLAVLPFENLGRPEDEYFGSGLAEEITSRLGKVQGLGVISRTSASQYSETEKSVREIGRELGVDYVLEGSVRWEGKGGAIRVTPQLVRVSDDRQLWSERYDAKLANVFEVQATIAEQVARSLDLALTAPERQALAARPTENLEAYAYYLRGNDYLVGSWGEDRRLSIAMEMYAKAVELDPGFALAQAKLSQAHSSFYASTIGGTDEDVRVAKRAAETALRLQPKLADAHVAMAYYLSRGPRAYDSALAELRIADQLQPNSAEVVEAMGLVERRRGRLREAVAYLKRAAVLDPRSADIAMDVGRINWFLRAYPEAEQHIDRAIELAPDWVAPHAQKAWLYVSWRGDVEEARRVLHAAIPAVGLGNLVGYLNPDAVFFLPESPAQAAAILELAPRDFEDDTALCALVKAEWHRLHGGPKLVRAYSDSARTVLERELRETHSLPWRRAFLGYAYAGLGRRADAEREGLEAEKMVPASADPMQRAFVTFAIARIYAIVGDRDAAIERLEYLMSIPSMVSAPLLRVDPTWAPLRGNPRFRRLLEAEAAFATPDSS
jgi:serine/threonine-protein kinase